MAVKQFNTVRFAPRAEGGYFTTVVARVNEYFETNNISPYANKQMWVKTVVMLLLYFVPYTMMVTGLAASMPWLFFSLWFFMGWGMIGIGTGVMHDANHGTYSAKKGVNSFVGRVLEMIGGYTVTWKIQHNVLHHTYTNIVGLDEDIGSFVLLRFSPRQPLYWFHKYQYIYAWFFYMIMTLYWMTAKDYVQIFRYKKHDLLAKQRVTLMQALFRITQYKLFYYAYIMVLPILYSGMPWYSVVWGFLIMHFTAGLVLSCIFQPAHVVEESAFKAPTTMEGIRHMNDSWAEHEVVNTTDFSPDSRIFSWFIGGLNYQIEHHLFTSVCSVHYPRIAAIVKSTTLSFGLPYNVQPTFYKAICGHANMLRILGVR